MPYKACTNCVMDTSDPTIRFDSSGRCHHCNDFDRSVLPKWDTSPSGRKRLEAIVSKIRTEGKTKEFDCLLGLSGGLDSSYMLHVMVAEFGLRPLVFHVDAGWNSELAVHNIAVLIEKLRLDLFTEVISWQEMRAFQLAWLKSGVPHIDIPQDHAFIATLYKFAENHRIRYILNGGNFSTESVQYPLQYYYYGTDMVHIRDIIRRFCDSPLPTYPFSSVFRHKLYLRYIRNVRVLKPLNYLPYDKELAAATLRREYGWRAYPQKHFESRFTAFFEGYWLPVRFGFDVRRVQFSSLMLSGQMTREDALERLSKPSHDPAELEHEFAYVAGKLEITAEQLRQYLTTPLKFYWDYRNNSMLLRYGARLLSALGLDRGGVK